MSASGQWDPLSVSARHWLEREIPGSVLFHDPVNGVLSVKTRTGEKYVPAGHWITRHDDGTVTISPEEPET